PRVLTTPLVTLLVVYITTVLVGFPALERTRPVVFTARYLRTHVPPSAAVGLYRLERWRASLRYYLGRRVERLDDAEGVRRFLESAAPAYVVMFRSDYHALHEAGVPLAIIASRPAVSGTTGRGFRTQVWN